MNTQFMDTASFSSMVPGVRRFDVPTTVVVVGSDRKTGAAMADSFKKAVNIHSLVQICVDSWKLNPKEGDKLAKFVAKEWDGGPVVVVSPADSKYGITVYLAIRDSLRGHKGVDVDRNPTMNAAKSPMKELYCSVVAAVLGPHYVNMLMENKWGCNWTFYRAMPKVVVRYLTDSEYASYLSRPHKNSAFAAILSTQPAEYHFPKFQPGQAGVMGQVGSLVGRDGRTNHLASQVIATALTTPLNEGGVNRLLLVKCTGMPDFKLLADAIWEAQRSDRYNSDEENSVLYGKSRAEAAPIRAVLGQALVIMRNKTTW